MMNNYENWHLDIDNNQIVWLSLDKPNAAVNSINRSILNELSQILLSIKSNLEYKGLVIFSGKSSGFIAGADISQFSHLENKEAALELLHLGQKTFNQLAELNIPTVALIDGFCLGGGLELALACRYRIAEADHSKLGLPEVMLGIHPGWGGSVRLPKLIGAINAMDLILTGRTISAKAAKKMGLLDDAIARRYLKIAATKFVLNPPQQKSLSLLKKCSNYSLARLILGKIFYQRLRKKIRPEFYPAPFSVLECWQKNGVDSTEAFAAEAESVAKLQENTTAKNLVHVFSLQEQLKALGKKSEKSLKAVHVIGAGTMGGDIAAWCALKGFTVTLQDKNNEMIAKSIERAAKLFKKKLKEPLKVRAALDRMIPDPNGLAVRGADVIIEAIFENLEVKQELFKLLEQQAKADAILATNTSSIPLDQINTVMKDPGRLVGIHYFNPVAKMMLVEVVQGSVTAPEVFSRALSFVHQQSKLPLPVKSSPGFLVNRILMPYLMESMELLQEGIAPQVIDAAAMDFGMPMGPIELADKVGLDVCLSVAKNLTQVYGGSVPEKLTKMVAAGQLGVKTNQGFYTYRNGKITDKKSNSGVSAEEKEILTQRLIYRFLNECCACLREEVVQTADLLDAGMIFGTGFAPFRGGPIHYAQAVGKIELLKNFNKLAEKFGPRFTPDAAWDKVLAQKESAT